MKYRRYNGQQKIEERASKAPNKNPLALPFD